LPPAKASAELSPTAVEPDSLFVARLANRGGTKLFSNLKARNPETASPKSFFFLVLWF
jgi:hypothetical protein